MVLYKVFVDMTGALYFNADDEDEAIERAQEYLSEEIDQAIEVVLGNGIVSALSGVACEVTVDRPPSD